MGNKDKKYIYLTFDEGFEAGYTEKILDTLKQENVKATFFITAHYVNTAGDIVKRMIDEGHIVGNHTVNHKSMPTLNEETLKNEVMKLHQTIYEKYGYEMKYIRPPMGEYSEKTLSQTQDLGYINVMWSIAYDDWDENKQDRPDYGKQKILDNIHNRSSNPLARHLKRQRRNSRRSNKRNKNNGIRNSFNRRLRKIRFLKLLQHRLIN